MSHVPSQKHNAPPHRYFQMLRQNRHIRVVIKHLHRPTIFVLGAAGFLPLAPFASPLIVALDLTLDLQHCPSARTAMHCKGSIGSYCCTLNFGPQLLPHEKKHIIRGRKCRGSLALRLRHHPSVLTRCVLLFDRALTRTVIVMRPMQS